MSRTYKRLGGWGSRSTRGYRNAVRNGVRRSKIPPDGWIDEAVMDDQCFVPYKVARKLHDQGMSRDKIIKKLRWRFKLRLDEAEKAAATWYHDCTCDECIDGCDWWWWKQHMLEKRDLTLA